MTDEQIEAAIEKHWETIRYWIANKDNIIKVVKLVREECK
jgi:hypothetical protein